jgi:phosphomethylpyrimidine synthase
MKKEKLPSATSVSRDPLPASQKVYVKGELHDIKVAMREIRLSDSTVPGVDGETSQVTNAPVIVYDTSGPYTDPRLPVEVRKGLHRLR